MFTWRYYHDDKSLLADYLIISNFMKSEPKKIDGVWSFSSTATSRNFYLRHCLGFERVRLHCTARCVYLIKKKIERCIHHFAHLITENSNNVLSVRCPERGASSTLRRCILNFPKREVCARKDRFRLTRATAGFSVRNDRWRHFDYYHGSMEGRWGGILFGPIKRQAKKSYHVTMCT